MRCEIVFGIGFDRDNMKLVDVEEKVRWIVEEASRRFGGCNVRRIHGGWIDASGKLVIEPGGVLTIEVLKDDDRDRVHLFAGIVRDHLHQSCVVLNILPEVQTEFV